MFVSMLRVWTAPHVEGVWRWRRSEARMRASRPTPSVCDPILAVEGASDTEVARLAERTAADAARRAEWHRRAVLYGGR